MLNQTGFAATPLGVSKDVVVSGLQSSTQSTAFLGSMIPALAAVIFLSTPRLRRQWSFRILVFALIVTIIRCALAMEVSCVAERSRELVVVC